jgi:flagellar P-ring protein FlgI
MQDRLLHHTTRKPARRAWPGVLAVFLVTGPALAEVRVQDVARLQGQRTNRLMGYGLVVGLTGTGDGEKYGPTIRALAAIHERYHQPIISGSDVKGNASVALVAVEATISEYGAREGQTIDVTVSAVGSAKSLKGGQLLTTPLQYALFDQRDPATQAIFALAGGSVFIPDEKSPTHGTLRAGAVMEQDCFYSFIDNGTVTLVLNDEHAGWTWAHVVARAINHELANPASTLLERDVPAPGGVAGDVAEAVSPKSVTVRIPACELARPANFISRVLQSSLFLLPHQQARVTINRVTKNVSFTSGVTVSPTVLQIPGVGTVLVGKAADKDNPAASREPIDFKELFDTLAAIKVTPDQLIDAIEHLYKTGTLHAQIQYE